MRTQKTKCQTQQSDMRAEMEQARRVPAPAYSCGELEWIWARINLCTRVDCRATTIPPPFGPRAAVGILCVCFARAGRWTRRASITRRPSRRVPRVAIPFLSLLLPFSPQQGPVGGYAMYLSREVLRPVPERVTPPPPCVCPMGEGRPRNDESNLLRY